MKRTAQDHLDWMFEREDQTLETWETPLVATFIESTTVVTRRLNNHRISYLEFEGPLGGDRGEVKRVIAGEYQSLTIEKELIQLQIVWQEDGTANTAQLDFFQNAVDESSVRNVCSDVWGLRILPLR